MVDEPEDYGWWTEVEAQDECIRWSGGYEISVYNYCSESEYYGSSIHTGPVPAGYERTQNVARSIPRGLIPYLDRLTLLILDLWGNCQGVWLADNGQRQDPENSLLYTREDLEYLFEDPYGTGKTLRLHYQYNEQEPF